MNKSGYQPTEACALCKGACCKQYPGGADPEDFGKPLVENLITALESGRWCVDWWEGDVNEGERDLSRTLYVRPASKAHEGELEHGLWHGECTFLTETGCSLEFDQRPRGCRMLEPVEGQRCIGHYEEDNPSVSDKEASCRSWYDKQYAIKRALSEVRKKREELSHD